MFKFVVKKQCMLRAGRKTGLKKKIIVLVLVIVFMSVSFLGCITNEEYPLMDASAEEQEVEPEIELEVEPETELEIEPDVEPDITYISPFDITVWGSTRAKQISQYGVSLSVPVPPQMVENVENPGARSLLISYNTREGEVLVNAILFRERGEKSFEMEAEDMISLVFDFLDGIEAYSSVELDGVYERDGSVIALFRFVRVVDPDEERVLEIAKVDEYNGVVVLTRMRLRGETGVDTKEFLRAFGLYKFYEAGDLSIGEF